MDVAHIAHQIITGLNWLALNIPWDAVLASGVLSGLMVPVYKKVKKWFDHHEVIIVTLIGILGPTLVALWTYVLHNYGTDPRIVALEGLSIAFMTQPFYLILIKPSVRRIGLWITAQVLAAQALNAATQADAATYAPSVAAAPATTVPTPANKVIAPIQDFNP